MPERPGILLCIAVLAATAALAQTPSIEGEGTAAADAGKFHLLLHVSKKSLDGTYEASLDNVEQGVKMPVSLLDYKGQDVRFELAPLSGTFIGKLNAAGTELSGEWQQGGRKLPITFTRAEAEIPNGLAASLA